MEIELKNYIKDNLHKKVYNAEQILDVIELIKDKFNTDLDNIINITSNYIVSHDNNFKFNLRKVNQSKRSLSHTKLSEILKKADGNEDQIVADSLLTDNMTDRTDITDPLLTDDDDPEHTDDLYIYPTKCSFPHFPSRSYYSLSHGPIGTQWIHDKQVDDVLDEKEEKLAIIYDKLRAIVLPEQRSIEWFQMRDGAITASDGGTVLGMNKHEPQYSFIVKKVLGAPFTSNKFCYHGKKLEEIATMIYSYRMNVTVDEFGLMMHPDIKFLGASPDGICNRYKFDGIHKSIFVGRMLEIKCPLVRKINKSGEIKDHICPIYYWVQVQLQLECCNLEECDFWQCDLKEYKDREEFINDTMASEPFRSASFGYEKGCLIQLLPKNKIQNNYWQTVYDDAIFIYPPKIEMSPHDCDIWIAETLSNFHSNPKYYNYVFDKVIWWRLEDSMNVTIYRDREWFNESLPTFTKMWEYVKFLKSHQTQKEVFKNYMENNKYKRNDDIMGVIHKICNPDEMSKVDYRNFLRKINAPPPTVSTVTETEYLF